MKEESVSSKIGEIVLFLSQVGLFKNLSVRALRELVQLSSLLFIDGSEILFNQGDRDFSLYIVYRGRLGVYRDKHWIANITSGQFLGEMGLLTKLPRTGTIQALRDSCLIKITPEAFNKIREQYTDEILSLAITAIRRLITDRNKEHISAAIKTITIAPAGGSDHRGFSQLFFEELKKNKQVVLINSSISRQHFDLNSVNGNSDSGFLAWLQSLETKNEFVLYETDLEMTPWSTRCLRQADCILWVATEGTSSSKNRLEKQVFDEEGGQLAISQLVFLHPGVCAKTAGSSRWIVNRPVNIYHHLRDHEPSDWKRMIRRLTGESLAVVLSGGGARGFMHVGALKAMEELNFPIDLIFGSSMGAVVGVTYAFLGVKGCLQLAKEFAKESKIDYTFPLVSLLKGNKICDFFVNHFENARIEDLWKQFGCVSTNLSKRTIEVHDRGKIWETLMATISIPGIFPPFYTKSGDMLVDGGVLNNLPVDIQAKYMTGGKILAVSVLNEDEGTGAPRNVQEHRGLIAACKGLIDQLNPLSTRNINKDSIFTIIMSAITLSAENHQRIWEQHADYLLKLNARQFGFLEFNAAEEIIELGYNQAREQLRLIAGTQKLYTDTY